MTAQIIPFPVPRVSARTQETIHSNPAFWGFCEHQYRLALEAGRPRPLYDDLVERYRRGER